MLARSDTAISIPAGIPTASEIITATMIIDKVCMATPHNPNTPMVVSKSAGVRVLPICLVRCQDKMVISPIHTHQGTIISPASICSSKARTRSLNASKAGSQVRRSHLTRAVTIGAT